MCCGPSLALRVRPVCVDHIVRPCLGHGRRANNRADRRPTELTAGPPKNLEAWAVANYYDVEVNDHRDDDKPAKTRSFRTRMNKRLP